MTKKQNALHGLTAVIVMLGIALGVYYAVHSSLFYLKSVQVEKISDGYPLKVEEIMDRANIQMGRFSLFSMDLKPVEDRLMKHPWVKGVVLSKQFPGTLILKIIERNPICLLNEENGHVLYIENDGTSFEDRSMVYPKELPMITGFSGNNPDTLKKVSHFMRTWFSPEALPKLKLSSISFDQKNGLRAMVTYPLTDRSWMRAMLELGMNIEEASKVPQDRLQKVLEYLKSKSLSASKIWLGDGKKIIVKISRGQ